MELSKEKVNELTKMDNDYAELVLKLNDYLTERYALNVPELAYSNIEEALNADSLNLIFTTKTRRNSNAKNIYYFEDKPNVTMENSQNILESAYYAGKVFEKRLTTKSIDEELEKIIRNNTFRKVCVIIDLDAVSSYPLWDTKMRRKASSIIDMVNSMDISSLDSKKMKDAILNAKMFETPKAKAFDLDFVLNALKEISQICDYTLYYVAMKDDNNQFSNEDIFFINELNKYHLALKASDTVDYVYDTVCKDMDEMFGKYRFCNFKNNKCFSQRHKSLKNNYPTPNTDGCCFKVFGKCKYNNKDGTCKVKCISCKLYTCPYLNKFGVGTRLSEFILMRNLIDTNKKKRIIYSFFKSKDVILKK